MRRSIERGSNSTLSFQHNASQPHSQMKQPTCLQRLAEAHLVRENAIDVLVVQANHPVQSLQLVLFHLAKLDVRRLHNQPRDCVAAAGRRLVGVQHLLAVVAQRCRESDVANGSPTVGGRRKKKREIGMDETCELPATDPSQLGKEIVDSRTETVCCVCGENCICSLLIRWLLMICAPSRPRPSSDRQLATRRACLRNPAAAARPPPSPTCACDPWQQRRRGIWQRQKKRQTCHCWRRPAARRQRRRWTARAARRACLGGRDADERVSDERENTEQRERRVKKREEREERRS